MMIKPLLPLKRLLYFYRRQTKETFSVLWSFHITSRHRLPSLNSLPSPNFSPFPRMRTPPHLNLTSNHTHPIPNTPAEHMRTSFRPSRPTCTQARRARSKAKPRNEGKEKRNTQKQLVALERHPLDFNPCWVDKTTPLRHKHRGCASYSPSPYLPERIQLRQGWAVYSYHNL